MSTSAPATLQLTFTHLSPDVRAAGADLPEQKREGVTARELRRLLRRLSDLAPTVAPPAEPAIRIAAPAGQFIVQVKAGRLVFISWASSQNATVTPPVDEIVRIATGEVVEGQIDEDTAPPFPEAANPRRRQRILLGALLVAVIVALNAFTLTEWRKPAGNFLAPHQLLDARGTARLLETVAGAYETGGQPGDRRLEITTDGAMRWIKYGEGRVVADRKELTVQAAEANGKPALLTSRQALITIKDPVTVVYFGDTYTRIANATPAKK